MSDFPDYKIDTPWIKTQRGDKNWVDPAKPYLWMVEKEYTHKGLVEDVGIIFLSNSECPYSCLMCDLWKNTTDVPVAEGAIPGQIEWALTKMPGVKHLKLYNSGNFFDKNAIPVSDYGRIADLLAGLETVIVENHPNLINERCVDFATALKPDLHVAMGLETVHPEILAKLNKKLSLNTFRSAVKYLAEKSISIRTFILLKPPFLNEEEGVYWAKKSLDFAFDVGVECCTIIPTRAGNGAMDQLEKEGFFSPPTINSLEEVLQYGLKLNKGRVFADTWDLELFSECAICIQRRKQRIEEINRIQKFAISVVCACK